MGRDLIEKDLVDLARHRKLGLELADPGFRGGQLHRLIGALSIDLTAVDLLLLEPEIDRRLAHPKRRRELLDTRPSRVVFLEAALPVQDTTDSGLVSDAEHRQYATREVRVRLHQHRFRAVVLAAYRGRCAVCSLREASLLQAAHIIEDREDAGAAIVVNGIALCAIHHLAYDRNVMGIDPSGVVHIAGRLLHEIDGPMLSSGLQAFHGERIDLPRRHVQHPDPGRLEVRYEQFKAAG